MLDPWIIEEIRRREEEERKDHRIPAVLELPLHQPIPDQGKPQQDDVERGVVIIDFG